MEKLYNMIFKRKSFRKFDDTLTLSEKELKDINQKIKSLTPLVNNIKVRCKIVPREKTTEEANEKKQSIYGKVI